MDIFILGASKPYAGKHVIPLQKVSYIKTVLDWQLESFIDIDTKNIFYLGGYQIQDVINKYPQINYILVRDWAYKKALNTFSQATVHANDALFCYADTVFRKEILGQILSTKNNVVIGVDLNYSKRYGSRSEDDISIAEVFTINSGKFKGLKAEFTGLVYLDKVAVEENKKIRQKFKGNNLLDFLLEFQNHGLRVEFFDVGNNWAELNEPADIAKFILGSKAETLQRIAPMLDDASIGAQISFSVSEWLNKQEKITSSIVNKFDQEKIIIRSSSSMEDTWKKSSAGEYKSILNIASNDINKVIKSINEVIDSYGASVDINNDQVLVQKFIEDVSLSGVIFTCSIETGSQYITIVFDESSGSSDSITSGTAKNSRQIVFLNSDENNVAIKSSKFKKLINLIKRIIQILSFSKLDIEFAIDQDENIHIFQIRPITIDHRDYDHLHSRFNEALNSGIKSFRNFTSSSMLLGERTCFSNMSDWNPAEMIGINPRPLAASLYSELITNKIWSKQRSEFGYKDCENNPLMVYFFGKPYIDVRASFNSFIPQDVNPALAEKIVNQYLDILIQNPEYHDKVEFEVVFTIWTPDFKKLAYERFYDCGISHEEILSFESSLISLTTKGINRLHKDTKKINAIAKNREQILLSKDLDNLSKIYLLLNDIKENGTLPFAHAARHGFIATSFLRSFENLGILTRDEKERFMLSITTTVGQLRKDIQLYLKKKISKSALIKKYGHLRPGTYDANIEAYWENPDFYFFGNNYSSGKELHSEYLFTDQQLKSIGDILKELKLKMKPVDFIEYLKEAIFLREELKFQFTKNLSIALDCLIEYGRNINLSRDEVTYLTYYDIEMLRSGLLNDYQLKKIIFERKEEYKLSQMFELPDFFHLDEEFFFFEYFSSKINFITNEKVIAKTLDVRNNNQKSLNERIILIPAADPGYDWIFNHEVSGLITQYGGANSHMAIKTAELGIPAAIGVGKKLYEQILISNMISLDCENKKIIILS